MRCDKCGSLILELWSKDKGAVWLACTKCDKPELDQMRQRKLEADIDKVMKLSHKTNSPEQE